MAYTGLDHYILAAVSSLLLI